MVKMGFQGKEKNFQREQFEPPRLRLGVRLQLQFGCILQ